MTLICICGGDIGQPASHHDISCPLSIEYEEEDYEARSFPLLTGNDMTPKQYTEAIDRLGLSQRAAGTFLGVDERQSRRWVAGDSAIPESVAKLLRLMVRLKLDPNDVK